MQSDRHEGRTVIVTGAASGIGRGIARRFGEEGAHVVVADVRRAPRQGTYYDTSVTTPTDEVIVNETSGDAIYVETDVSDPQSVESMVDRARDEYDRLDVLVNNAGIYIGGNSQEITVEEWQRLLSIDLDGVFYCAKYAIPYLTETQGHIINVGSVHANEGGGGPPYASAKAGVQNLTRDLAVELGEEDVNVNAINPGFIETPIQDYLSQEEIDETLEHTLLPRGGQPEDIGDAAVFLASDEASFIHGEAVHVDGGWTAHRL